MQESKFEGVHAEDDVLADSQKSNNSKGKDQNKTSKEDKVVNYDVDEMIQGLL